MLKFIQAIDSKVLYLVVQYVSAARIITILSKIANRQNLLFTNISSYMVATVYICNTIIFYARSYFTHLGLLDYH